MNKYTCTATNSILILTYNAGFLTKIESEDRLYSNHVSWIFNNDLCIEDNILKINNKNIKVVRIKVSFEDFWNKYNYKKDKENAKKQWNKLSELDQQLAYNGIYKFKKCNGNYGQPALPYAERYLKYKRWEDED